MVNELVEVVKFAGCPNLDSIYIPRSTKALRRKFCNCAGNPGVSGEWVKSSHGMAGKRKKGSEEKGRG